MKRIITLSIASAVIATAFFTNAQSAHAQTSFNFSSDNDGALYVGNATGSNLRLIGDQTTAWNASMTSGSFTLQAGEDYFYLLGMNYGWLGDMGGDINGISMTSVSNWEYTSLSLTGMPSTHTTGCEVFTPLLSDVESAISAGGFIANPNIVAGDPGAGGGYVSHYMLSDDLTFELPLGTSAQLMRQPVSAFGLSAATAAPEPASLSLLLLGGIVALRRRRKQA
jgi:hypothetical protein